MRIMIFQGSARNRDNCPELHYLLKNHYEGKYAAFFIHGDAGGSDYYEFAKKKGRHLPVLPQSYKNHMKKDKGLCS